MRLEHLDETLVLALIFLDALELVAAGAEGAAGGVPQGGDVRLALLARVDELLAEHADDAVLAGEHLADPVAVRTGRFDHPAGGGVDHRRHSARLGVEHVFSGHGLSLVWT